MTTFFHLFIQIHPQREFASQNNKPLPRISPNIYFQLFIDFKITFSKCTLWVFCLTVSLFVSPSPHLSENWSRLPGIPRLSSNISLGLRSTPFWGSIGCLEKVALVIRTKCCWSPKILTKNGCCGAKYCQQWTWLGSTWSCFSLSKKRPKQTISGPNVVKLTSG